MVFLGCVLLPLCFLLLYLYNREDRGKNSFSFSAIYHHSEIIFTPWLSKSLAAFKTGFLLLMSWQNRPARACRAILLCSPRLFQYLERLFLLSRAMCHHHLINIGDFPQGRSELPDSLPSSEALLQCILRSASGHHGGSLTSWRNSHLSTACLLPVPLLKIACLRQWSSMWYKEPWYASKVIKYLLKMLTSILLKQHQNWARKPKEIGKMWVICSFLYTRSSRC